MWKIEEDAEWEVDRVIEGIIKEVRNGLAERIKKVVKNGLVVKRSIKEVRTREVKRVIEKDR